MRRLGRLAEGLLEAGWLSTVTLLPLFIDKNGSEVFEPAKAGMLRALALVMLAAWLAKALTVPSSDRKTAADATLLARLLRTPLLLPAALVLVTAALATWLSVAPRESFWGHSIRAQGFLTLLAQLTVFAATAVNLSTSAQLHRLVSALILPSLPIAMYAIAERFGYEPLQVTVRQTDVQRVTSLLGQPVFLAAYLGMIMPFGVLRLVSAVRERARSRGLRRATIALYALVLLTQAVAALLTESRGPLLGIAAAFAVAFLTLAARYAWRRAVIAVVAAGAGTLVLLALAVSTVLSNPNAGAEATRIARRAVEIFDVRGGGGQFRLTNWEIAERVIRNRKPLELADGSRDLHPALRPLVGYGPEVQYGISPPFYGPELPRYFDYFLTDRYHNDLWDVLVTTGLLGLAAWLALQASLFRHYLRELGLLSTVTRTRMFWVAYVGGAGAGALGWTLLDGLPLIFLGLQVGALVGVAAFLVVLCFAGHRRESTGAAGQPVRAIQHDGLLLAGLAALVAHVVETSFSFTLITTGMLFWLLVALPSARVRAVRDEQAVAAAPAPARAEPSLAEPVSAGALLALNVMALGFAFLGGLKISSESGQVLWDGLTLLAEPPGARIPIVGFIVLATLVLGALLLALDPSDSRAMPPLWQRARWTLGIACAATIVYLMRLSVVLSERGIPAKAEEQIVSRNLQLRLETVTSFYVAGLLVMLVLGVALTARTGPREQVQRVPWWRWVATACGAAAAAMLISPCVLRPTTARAAAALGDALLQQNKLILAEQAYTRAIQSDVEGDMHHARLAKAYARHARLDAKRSDAWYQLANQAMIEAVMRNRLATENATNLAMVRGNWALRASGEVRREIGSTVPALYARALRLNPSDPTLRRMWATVQVGLLRDPVAAVASARKAVELDPDDAPSYATLAECQAILAGTREGPARTAGFLEAATNYGAAARLAPDVPEHRVGEAKAYLRAGQPQRAVGAMRDVLARTPEASPVRKAASEVLRSAESAVAVVSEPSARP